MPTDVIIVMATKVANKGRISKRTSNSYSSDEWKRHRPLITQLYSDQGRTLKEVREHLEREYGFAPTERMYKSRLHAWGLNKKKKEHEMLDLVRQGLSQEGVDEGTAFVVRGKPVTVGDALHYFQRKGVQNPASLLQDGPQTQQNHSPPDGYGVQTLPSKDDNIERQNAVSVPDYDPAVRRLDVSVKNGTAERMEYFKAADLASNRLRLLCAQSGHSTLPPLPPFRTVEVEAHVESGEPSHPESTRYLEAIYAQTQLHYRELFRRRAISLTNSYWSSTPGEYLSDQFYYLYHSYSSLWNDQRQTASKNFQQISDVMEQLLREGPVSFLIYIFDLVIRHAGTVYQEPLLFLLQRLADLGESVWQNTTNPIHLIASWLLDAPAGVSKSWVALSTLRRLLGFFQDSIGYFHPATIALLQTFATGLLNKKYYHESTIRFRQLVDAAVTTKCEKHYEVCHALRSTSEAYFHTDQYGESLQAIQMGLEWSRGLRWAEEREILVRCLQAMAEISKATGRQDQAYLSDMLANFVSQSPDAIIPSLTSQGPPETFKKGE